MRARKEKPWSTNEESVKKRVGRLYTERWDYLHDDAHVLAYCLNPQNGVLDLNELERKGALNALKEMVPEKQRAQALQEYGKSVLVSPHLMSVQICSLCWSLIHCPLMAGGRHTPTLALCRMLLLPWGPFQPLLVQQNGTGTNLDNCILETETD